MQRDEHRVQLSRRRLIVRHFRPEQNGVIGICEFSCFHIWEKSRRDTPVIPWLRNHLHMHTSRVDPAPLKYSVPVSPPEEYFFEPQRFVVSPRITDGGMKITALDAFLNCKTARISNVEAECTCASSYIWHGAPTIFLSRQIYALPRADIFACIHRTCSRSNLQVRLGN